MAFKAGRLMVSLLALLSVGSVSEVKAVTMTYPMNSTVIHERAADFADAELKNVEWRGDALVLQAGETAGTLTSAPLSVTAFNELVPSWNAVTPGTGTLTLEVRTLVGGKWSRWFSFGAWSSAESRSSVNGQKDASGQVLTDTLRLNSKSVSYQYRVTLRGAGTSVRLLAFNTTERAGHLAKLGQVSDQRAWGKVLNVPQRSQMIYPDGGEVWCSPTSVTMILAQHGVNVTVPFAAKATYDRAYEGTGNWPFNTAFAATQGMRAFVTRLPSLAEAEKFTAAGYPLAVSLGWGKGELPGAPLSTSDGHLMVLVGFDAKGNPVLNDPAAPSNDSVRRTYPRAAFEKLWLTHSGGLSYVITPQGAKLP